MILFTTWAFRHMLQCSIISLLFLFSSFVRSAYGDFWQVPYTYLFSLSCCNPSSVMWCQCSVLHVSMFVYLYLYVCKTVTVAYVFPRRTVMTVLSIDCLSFIPMKSKPNILCIFEMTVLLWPP